MKFFLAILLLIASFAALSKEIYLNTSSQAHYLFIGGIDLENDKKKFLDLNNNAVVWLSDVQLQQVSQLTPFEFGNKIFASGLTFHASGSEPFWNAEISKDRLWLSQGVENGDSTLAIKTYINQFSMDGQFIMTLNSTDHKLYAVIIEARTASTVCENGIGGEDDTVYEVYINIQGTNLSGCAPINPKKK